MQVNLKKWITGPKSPGLIILEHELSNYTVSAFIDAFPQIKSNGWNIVSVAELDGGSAYHNANGDEGTVTVDDVTAYGENSPPPPSASNSTSSASSSATPSGGTKAGSSGDSGSKSSSGTNGPQPTGANQTSGALSMMLLRVGDVRSVFAAFATLLLSAFALA